jgi:hypothetical protein
MVIKRIGPMSCARIAGPVYAVIGLCAGVFISLASLLGATTGDSDAGFMGVLFGVGAIIMLPVFYGLLGFLGALFSAWLYNLMAGAVGGIDVDIS